MQLPQWKKWALGILGALGMNALWDYVAKPGTQWIVRTILTIITFGSASLKDVVYRQAAKGLHEEASISMLFFVAYWAGCLLAFGVFFSISQIRDDLNDSTNTLKRLDGHAEKLEAGIGHTKEVVDEISQRSSIENLKTEIKGLIGKSKKRIRRMIFIGCISLVLYATDQIGSYMQISESNSSYTFFRQSMAICRPYMSDQDSQMLKSKFAAIQGRADYISVIGELQQIAETHHRKLPQFSPW